MEALMLPEEWLVGNVLAATDLYAGDDLQGYADHFVESDFIKPDTNKQASVLTDDVISSDLSWLDDATCIENLDASLQSSILDEVSLDPVADILAELETLCPTEENAIVGSFEAQAKFMIDKPLSDEPFQAPCSPVEISLLSNFPAEPVVKYLQPSTIDTSGLKSEAQVVMNDLNVLHLPETGSDAAQLLLQALADPNVATQLDVTEVESILSSPPSSPEALVPRSPDPDSDEEFTPPRKRRCERAGSQKGRKTLKPDEKRERKRAQNKNAATKYRNKKRDEESSFKIEFDQLESKNVALKRKVEDLSSEIKYMKDLLNDALKGKGLRIK